MQPTVKTENQHLTLKFLGDTQNQQIPEINQALQTIANETAELRLTLHNARYFPRASQARVVACPIEHNEALKDLAARIDAVCASLGFSANDRAYRGHISIGRVKQHTAMESGHAVSNAK